MADFDDKTTLANQVSWSYSTYRWLALILYTPFIILLITTPFVLSPVNLLTGTGFGFGFIYMTYHTWRLIMTCTELKNDVDITTTEYAPRLSITSMTSLNQIHKILRYELSYLTLPYIGIGIIFGTLGIGTLLYLDAAVQYLLVIFELIAFMILFFAWAVYGIYLKRKR
jgi:hypothetical protein